MEKAISEEDFALVKKMFERLRFYKDSIGKAQFCANKEAEAKRLKELERCKAEEVRVTKIMSDRRASGLCQHCGGAFKGLFTKTCVSCGKKKDY